MGNDKSRCWFCFMQTSLRWLGISLCPICRDQLYDFVWVSLAQSIVWILGRIDGLFFIVDEILLFLVLVVIKHRLPTPWEAR